MRGTMRMASAMLLAVNLILSAPAAAQDGWGRKLGEVLGELPLGEYYRSLTGFNDVQWVTNDTLVVQGVMYRVQANSNVNVRAGTSTQTAVVASASPNERVMILKKQPFEPWFLVQLANGTQGYIHESLLTQIDD
ncbi:hypothetical protein CWI76_06010 [Pseudidiomarina marina]|uniref:SH3b domain-containing protein n=2 Tax=Pseudidiomarina marina TaxID=502366 RepID=A0A432YFG3_9GAMM|nr:hypothetical protein CWI76_06010 [Pseudidiomarina marina]